MTHRYREELRRHADPAAAMAVTIRSTYGTLLASASTVILAMLCLLAASSGSLLQHHKSHQAKHGRRRAGVADGRQPGRPA
jgi:MMPL family